MTDARKTTLGTAAAGKREELLGILLRRKGLKVSTGEPEIHRANAASYQPSFAQERLWFLQQLEPDSCLYNMTGVWSLQGQLDVGLLVRSIQEIARRHESLRTVFVVHDGGTSAVVLPELALPVLLIETGDKPPAEQDVWLQQKIAEQAQQPFDLERGPLIRVALLRVHPQMHALVVVMHHIISDGWSFRTFRRELQTLYTAGAEGTPASLSALPIQYADYACWQRRWLEGERLQAQLSCWRKRLEGISPLELPLDHPRPRLQRNRGAHVASALAEDVTELVREISRETRCTAFMILFAAFSALMHRLAAQNDICVGIPVANRDRAELEELIGFFVNTLVLRADFSADPTFSELLHQVRQTALEAYAHHDLPFERLVQEIAPERDASRNPLFQVFFNMDSSDDEPFQLPGLVVNRIHRQDVSSKFDLTLYARDRNGHIRFDLVYDSDLFDAPRMTEMLAQLEHLLRQALEHPQEKIARLSLVTLGARQVLPDPAHPLPSRWEGPIDACVAQTVAEDPHRIAATDGVGAWTYAELEAVSNRLAGCLRANGVQRGDVVAIYGDRTVSLVASLLGVLRAGAAFVVLDPGHPAARLHGCLRAAGPTGCLVLRTAPPVPDSLRDVIRGVRFYLEIPEDPRACEALAGYPERAANARMDRDEPAYIAFTSGSSHGTPQGVLGSHGPVSHFLRWHCETFAFNQYDRFSMLSGLSHDPLLRDILTPLRLGATLCIPRREDMEHPWSLARWLSAEKVTVAHMTPALADMLTTETAHGRPEPIPSLRYIFFGGDVLTRRQIQQVRQIAPHATCVNFYGATETPQAMSCHVVCDAGQAMEQPQTRPEKSPVPIGHGIEGVQLLIMNKAQQLAGIGERGEIWVRSPYLARGYIDDTCATGQFIRNPFTGDAQDRIYRTGDSGCYRPDGCVEFCGRMDRQIKIRGFRVEPAEIESALRSHPAVAQAVVTTDDDGPAGKRLTAYVTSDGSVSTLSLRGHLRTLLPEYMIPSQLIVLRALPLTPNGKIDLAQLRRNGHPIQEQTRRIPPHTAMEKKVARIWQEAIGVGEVGRQDSFFDLGGHSLLVVKAVAMLEKDVGIRVPFREFFTQTLAQFAAYCDEKASERLFHA